MPVLVFTGRCRFVFVSVFRLRRFLGVIAVGLGLQLEPGALQHLPDTARVLLASGLLPAAFLAILLNLLIPGTGYLVVRAWIRTATGLALLTLILALPGAYVFARYEFRGKALLQSLVTVPFVLPTVVTAAAFRALLGPGGLVNAGLMAGANYILHAAGWLEGGLAMSYEKFIIDADQASMMAVMTSGSTL